MKKADREERNQKIVAMSRQGLRVNDIAEAVGLSSRGVERVRRQYNVVPPRSALPMTAEELKIAEEMLADDCPYTEVAATLGRGVDTIAKRFPGRGWSPIRARQMRDMNKLLQQCGSIYGITK